MACMDFKDMKAKFSVAPWGARVRWITLGVLILLGGMALLPIFLRLPWQLQVFIGGLNGVLVAVTSLFCVRGYELDGHTLHVIRPFWITTVSLEGLNSVEIDPNAFQGSFKTVGNDGLFAIHGRFRSRRLGRFRAFATDPAKAVVLRFEQDLVVVTPDYPLSFERAVREQIQGARVKS